MNALSAFMLCGHFGYLLDRSPSWSIAKCGTARGAATGPQFVMLRAGYVQCGAAMGRGSGATLTQRRTVNSNAIPLRLQIGVANIELLPQRRIDAQHQHRILGYGFRLDADMRC